MANSTLTAISPLDGYEEKFDGFALNEVNGKALVSIATAMGKERALASALSKSFKSKFPKIGTSTHSPDGKFHLLGLQDDQIFVMFDYDGLSAADDISLRLGDAGYCSDQSDSWVMLSISGERSREVLERICMLDLAADVFTTGTVARTMMEHLATIIVRTDEDSFLLLSPRSSAKSFLTIVEISIRNVL